MKRNLQINCLSILGALILAVQALGYIIADSKGLLRVAVEVEDSQSGQPVEDATVTLMDSGIDDLKSEPDFKRFVPLFEPVRTNLAGHTTVYYYDGVTYESGKGQTVNIRGKLRVTKAGYADVETDLRKVIGLRINTGNEHRSVPSVTIVMERKK